MTNFLKGWRTVIFNGLIAALAAYKLANPAAEPMIDAVILLGTTVGNLILRKFTTTPIGTK